MKHINCSIITQSRFDPSQYNVLIVEDSKSFNKILTHQLQKDGFHCYSAFCLKDAYEYLASNRMDYILLDINLPDGNGYELIVKLENSPQKIFVLTGESDKNFREDSYQKGVIDFIVKDKNFFHKMVQISGTIKQLEKNKSQTILIVDSSPLIQKKLKDVLSNRHYHIEIANDEAMILEIIEKNKIDLMFLDVQFGNTNGIEFLQKHTNLILGANKISVLLTAENVDSMIMRDGLKAGAVDVLRKPYALEEVVLKADLWIDYKRKEDEILCSTQFLKEYKKAIDRSSIVSKTDKHGIITYANEQFCKISGYSESELIGQPHSIIRHPDMAKDAFEWMWYTIKELKQPWEGEVKNRKKDGGYYWVQSTISPILDADGNVFEYIGIRTDITQQKIVSKYFENQLDISTKNFSESQHHQKEVDDAIDKFTAILKTDTTNKIIYANDYFCGLSKYDMDELRGMDCSNLRHQNHILNNDCENIKLNLSQNKHTSILFTNIAKDGSLYFVDTIVYPVTNTKGEIIEHLHLMHDISELTNLHKEIEDTQKEIVYKMGEIGESRSKETGNHVKRVAEYSKLLALLFGMSEKEAEILFIASPMHDIGKVGISDDILKKPAKLTTEEFEIMKTHATIGYEILKNSNREVLQAAAIVSSQHHERWDGKGYPERLQGEDIHIYGRITAIADVFDALGSERCYKPAWMLEDILELFQNESDKQFDGRLVNLLLDNLELFLDIRDKFRDVVSEEKKSNPACSTVLKLHIGNIEC